MAVGQVGDRYQVVILSDGSILYSYEDTVASSTIFEFTDYGATQVTATEIYYTRGNYSSLPSNASPLEVNYTATEISNVSISNDTRVAQSALDEYTIHQYKNLVYTSGAKFVWEGQSNVAPSTSKVYLQIYDVSATQWVTLASENTVSANTDFTMTATVASVLNYKDNDDYIACRIYQLGV